MIYLALIFACILFFSILVRNKRDWVSNSRLIQRFKSSQLPPIEPLRDFEWQKKQPKKLRPFKPIYNITMGIQADNLSELITIDRDYQDRVTARHDIVAEYNKTVHGCLPGGEDAVRELYSYLMGTHLPSRFPTMFKVSEKNVFHNMVTGKSFPVTPPQDPEVCLRTLAETVEEDIFLMKDDGETHISLAFTCCFPTGFDPSQKLGRTLKEIHQPVPSYDKIGPSMERFFRKLAPGKSVKRMNVSNFTESGGDEMSNKTEWVVQTHADLINTSGNHIKDGDEFVADEDVDHSDAHLRVELQSLTRLPKTQFVLFCFKTYLYPIREVKAEGNGPALADAIEGLQKGNAPGMFKYKSAIRWGKSVAQYLRS